MANLTKSLFTDRIPSQVIVSIASFMLILSSITLSIPLLNKPEFEFVTKLRGAQLCIAITIFLLSILRKKKWSPTMNSTFFVIIAGSIFTISWFTHVAMVASPETWSPFPVYQIGFIVLAILVPGSYLLNLILILFYMAEVLVIWFVLDLGHRPNIIHEGEPFQVLMSGIICIMILFFRYRNELAVKTLATEITANEFTSKLAKVFLSLRDKSNTPMQTLVLQTELIKRKGLLDKETLKPITNSMQTLIEINKRLSSLESAVDWGPNHLLTDAEIEQWLTDLEKEMVRFKRNGPITS